MTPTGEEMAEPEAALKVTGVVVIGPAEGSIENAGPPPLTTFAAKLPEPVRVTLDEAPQATGDGGETVNPVEVGGNASPLSPWSASTIDVSIVRPVEPRTMKATLPQLLSDPVKEPPLADTIAGFAVASAGNGEAMV